MLEGETPEKYTDRLTGADRTDRRPYDHERNRQCSIGYHDECSDPDGVNCECPCHTAVAPQPRHDDPCLFVLHTRAKEVYADGVAFWEGQVVYRIRAEPQDDDQLDQVHILGLRKFKQWVDRAGLTLVWIDQVPPELPDPAKAERWT